MGCLRKRGSLLGRPPLDAGQLFFTRIFAFPVAFLASIENGISLKIFQRLNLWVPRAQCTRRHHDNIGQTRQTRGRFSCLKGGSPARLFEAPDRVEIHEPHLAPGGVHQSPSSPSLRAYSQAVRSSSSAFQASGLLHSEVQIGPPGGIPEIPGSLSLFAASR